MPEQDFVTIPNQPGAPGSPINAQIAADDPSGIGVGPFVQQVSLANLTTELRSLVQLLSILGVAQDAAGTGRLRIVLDAITGNLSLNRVGTIGGFGGLGTAAQPFLTDASYMPFDLMMDSWANNVRRNIV